MSVAWFGDRAVQFPVPDRRDRGHVLREIEVRLPDVDVRPGMSLLMVSVAEPDPGLKERVERVLSAIAAAGPGQAAVGVDEAARTVRIPVHYRGPDLEHAADALGCGVDDVVSAHALQVWQVAMMGFAPGFGYLVPIGDPRLDWAALPRRSSPRRRVPTGSVAIAAGMSAVYPSGMPGGWHLIGRTDEILFDPEDERTPALLSPGDVIHFVPVLP